MAVTKPTTKQIKDLRKQVEEDDRKDPSSAEKRVKVTGSFGQAIKKAARTNPKKS